MQLIQLNKTTNLVPINVDEPQKPSLKAHNLLIFDYSQLTVNLDTKTHIIFLKEISHLKAEGNYTIIYLQNSYSILTSKTLKYWENKINSKFFFRTHNSTLVNKFQVASIDSLNSIVELKNGLFIPISRRMKNNIKAYF